MPSMDDTDRPLDKVSLADDVDTHQRRRLAAEMDTLESAENVDCAPANGDCAPVSTEEVEAELAALEESVTLSSPSDDG